MGRKRNRHKNKGANDPAFDPANPNKTSNWGGLGTAAPTPLVACQPSADGVGGALVAIAYGSSFSVHDASADDALVPLTHAKDNIAEGAEATGPCADGRWHAETIRVLRFDPTGRFLVTGGDDKILRLWRVVEKKRELSNDDNGVGASVTTSSTVTMECYKKTKKQPKKLCGGDFTNDGEYVTFANKYGDVHIWPTAETMCDRDLAAPRLNEKGDPEYDKHAPAFLLGHCCSIITDVCLPLGSRYICTADRDHRIRVSYLPRTVSLMGGSHEIQSFCFGHTAFVACVAAVGGDMIVSGGGDGTARLWRLDDGELLRRVHIYTGSHTTASARWTPILKDFSRRSSLSAQPSLSIPTHLDAFQRQLTPFNSTPTFARMERPSARSSSPSRTTTTTRRSWRRCCRRRSGPGSGSWRRVARFSRGVPKGVPKASRRSRETTRGST